MIIEALNRTPLSTVLLRAGFKQVRAGAFQREDQLIEIEEPEYVDVKARISGRSAIDLVTWIARVDASIAAAWLKDSSDPGVWSVMTPSKEPTDVRPRTLKLPLASAARGAGLYAQLCRYRGIRAELVTSLLDSGRIWADGAGNLVAVMMNQRNQPVGAEIHALLPNTVEPMTLAHGTQRDLGAFMVSSSRANGRVVLVETAVEALAYASMKPHDSAISIGGVFNHGLMKWMAETLDNGAARVAIGLSATELGDLGAAGLHREFGYPRVSPSDFTGGVTTWAELARRVQDASAHAPHPGWVDLSASVGA